MKSAHEEEAADKTQDHTGTKQIWTEAVSTCVLKRSLKQQASLRTSKQLCTICSHSSRLERHRQQAGTFFSLHCTQWHTGFKWNLILPLIAISHTFSINQLMGNVPLPGSHTVSSSTRRKGIKHSACVGWTWMFYSTFIFRGCGQLTLSDISTWHSQPNQ